MIINNIIFHNIIKYYKYFIMESNNIIISLIGKNIVGKSSLCNVYFRNIYSNRYIPTLEDTYYKEITYKNKIYNFEFIDTQGDMTDIMNTMYINKSHAVILVYSTDNIESFYYIKDIIYTINNMNKQIPYFVCSTKNDLTTKISLLFANTNLNFNKYHDVFEVSVTDVYTIQYMFETIIEFVTKKYHINKKKTKCILL